MSNPHQPGQRSAFAQPGAGQAGGSGVVYQVAPGYQLAPGAPGAPPPGAHMMPAPYVAPGYGYGPPQAYSMPMQPTISSFPTALAVLLGVFVPFFALIYYGVVHGNLPRRRYDDPGAGKAIGFMFIPFFNIYWMCFFWVRLCTRVDDERMRIGLPPASPRSLVIATLWCHLGLLIPLLNLLVIPVVMVMLLVCLIQLQMSINGLAAVYRR